MSSLLRQFAEFLANEALVDKTWVVGGAVRDWLLKRPSYDIDLAILSNCIFELVERFSNLYKCSYVHLDKDLYVCRIVKQTQIIDISKLRYNDIALDLSERDLTINAMAVSLPEFLQNSYKNLLDPYGGSRDIQNSVIRVVSEQNLIKDPLRLLRVFRFAVSLGFGIEPKTLKMVSQLAHLIETVSEERIAYELRHTLEAERTCEIVAQMANLLKHILHDFDILNLKTYTQTESLLKKYLPKQFDQSLVFAVKFASLNSTPEICKSNCLRLKLSKQETSDAVTTQKVSTLIINAFKSNLELTNRSVLETMFVNERILPYALALAEAKCPQGAGYFECLLRFFDTDFKARKKLLPIISGDEIMQLLNIKPSKQVGLILSDVRFMVLSGQLHSKAQAKHFVLEHYHPKAPKYVQSEDLP